MPWEKPKTFVKVYRFCPDVPEEVELVTRHIREMVFMGYKIAHQTQTQNQVQRGRTIQYMGPIHSDGDLHSLRSPARILYTITMTTLTITFELR